MKYLENLFEIRRYISSNVENSHTVTIGERRGHRNDLNMY